MRRASVLVCLLLSALGSGRVQAQEVRPSVRAVLAAEALDRRAADTLLAFHTRSVPAGRLDRASGVLRAAYGIAGAPAGPDPAASARAYLRRHAAAFGLDASGTTLAVDTVTATPYSRHVTFRQTLAGLPVYERFVRVNLTRDGRPTQVLNGYAPHLDRAAAFDPIPTLTPETAAARVRALVREGPVRTGAPELVVYPDDPPRLAWRLTAWPAALPVEWEALVDARSGDLIRLVDRSTHGPAAPYARTTTRPATSTPSAPAARLVDGTGFVFDPDPLTTADAFYGGPYVDQGDADVAAVNAELFEVSLRDITQGTDGLYRLVGPYAQIVGEAPGGATLYQPPAVDAPGGFRFTRADDFFEAVNTYFHVDKSQRYVQSLDVGRAIQGGSMRVNPHGLGTDDNSKFFPSVNMLAFGTGGVDDAEDAHVIWHEYGHALLEGSAPGLLNSFEGQALHEGWSDYWAASYARSLVDDGLVTRADWQQLFKWDSGDGQIWSGRYLDHTGRYPDDTYCDEGGFACDIYSDGLLWATVLMEIYSEVGRTVTDRLNLFSHAYLVHPVTMRDAAEALVQADIDLYGGAHVDALFDHLSARGFLDPATFAPILVHEPIVSVEQTGGTASVRVEVVRLVSPIDSVFVRYRIGEGATETLMLEAQGEGVYTGTLPLPGTPGLVAYAVQAVDALGLRSRLPDDDEATFAFYVGPDTEAPLLAHTPPGDITVSRWPVTITAEAVDLFGIDTVYATFEIEPPDEGAVDTGRFGLAPALDGYQGTFPPAPVQVGSRIRYRIHARDASSAANEAVVPADSAFSFSVTAGEGILRAFTFEEAASDVQVTGVWARGAPAYGLRVAHGGTQVLATGPAAAYPEAATLSTLHLPAVNLLGLETAYLVFWHWYDTEHDGSATPESGAGAVLWDGGNVKVSTDGGLQWEVLTPEGGYNGTLAEGRENPLGGEPAFGGYAYGWRRVVVPLPAARDVRVRFDFGTDDGNTEPSRYGYAGWYVDDVVIDTKRPVDTTPPTVTSPPAALIFGSPEEALPDVHIDVQDDTGIAAAYVAYQVFTEADTRRDTLRLEMNPAVLRTFQGAWPFRPDERAVGDSVQYRILLTDFAGRETVFPPAGESPLRIEYRLTRVTDLFDQIVASGLWRATGESWSLTFGDEQAPERSSLVLGPIDLPVNADIVRLNIQFQMALAVDLGGNVKVSDDGGATWSVLLPDVPYDQAFDAGTAHVMQGEPVFTGVEPGVRRATFDLDAYNGRQIWLRVDFGAARPLAMTEFWRLDEAVLQTSTLTPVEGGFDVPRELALHPNFPNPFSGTTTLSFTLPASMHARLEVYDLLGRRVARLVDDSRPAGTYLLTFDGGALASGVYLLRLHADGEERMERLVIVH